MSEPKRIASVVSLPGVVAQPGRPPVVPPHWRKTGLTDEQQAEVTAWGAAWDAWNASPAALAEAQAEADEKSRHEQEAAAAHRGQNLAGAPDLRVTDALRAALLRGGMRETKPLVAVRDWLANEAAKPWLVLSGATGCGKSAAAAFGVSRMGGTWVRAEKLVRIFYANFGDQFEAQDAIRDADFLVLDDVGSETDPARMAAALLEILDSRKSTRMHRTIVTTNLTQAKFVERYKDPRIVSRLHEQAEFFGDASADLRRST